MKIELFVNNEPKTFDIDPGDFLLDTLRANHYTSVRRGCDNTSCGVCTVLIDGKPVPSCSYLSARAAGKHVTTVEGIQEVANKLSDHFGKEGADQCGYCNPSMALTVHAMKEELKDPTDEEINDYLVGNLCRCTGYVGQHKAIKSYLEDES